jgi:hypothetical protein
MAIPDHGIEDIFRRCGTPGLSIDLNGRASRHTPIQCPEFPVFIGCISETWFTTPFLPRWYWRLLLRFLHIGKLVFLLKTANGVSTPIGRGQEKALQDALAHNSISLNLLFCDVC